MLDIARYMDYYVAYALLISAKEGLSMSLDRRTAAQVQIDALKEALEHAYQVIAEQNATLEAVRALLESR